MEKLTKNKLIERLLEIDREVENAFSLQDNKYLIEAGKRIMSLIEEIQSVKEDITD